MEKEKKEKHQTPRKLVKAQLFMPQVARAQLV